MRIFSTKGRIGRLEYLGMGVLQGIFMFLVSLIGGALLGVSLMGTAGTGQVSLGAGGVLGILVILAGAAGSIWMGVCAVIKRTRDAGWSVKLVAGLYIAPWPPLLLSVLASATGIVPLVLLSGALAVLTFPLSLLLMLIVLALFFKGPSKDLPPRGDERAAEARARSQEPNSGMEAALGAMLAKQSAAETVFVEAPRQQRRSAAEGHALLTSSPAQRGGFGRRGIAG